jgi:replicative DNA helicase
MGKTALGMQIADHAAVTRPGHVLVCSLEMARRQLGERFIAATSGVEGEKLRRPNVMGYGDLNRIAQAVHGAEGRRMVVDDAPAQSVAQIAATARRIKSRHGLGMILIDYLSLIDGHRQPGENRQEEVARISRRLKAMARSLSVPVLCLHQLNRQNEARGDKRPTLGDLRESGQIEQDADSVMLIHRPDYYNPNDNPGIAEIIVAKNRNGPTGTVRLAFVKSCTRFDSLAVSDMAQGPY